MENSIPFYSSNLILCCFLILSCRFHCYYSLGEVVVEGGGLAGGEANSFTAYSFKYPETRLRPFDLRYIRGLCDRFRL